jgi:hypothetical protein
MPAIDFPNSPTVNQEFTANGRTWIWSGTVWESKAVDTTVSRYKVGDAAPSSPVNGDVWFNSTNARTYVYYDSFWVESNPALDGKSGVSAVASPLTNSGTPTSAVLGLNYNALQTGQNYIINGAFDIWQRGTSAVYNGGSYSADRWVCGSNSTTISRDTDVPTGISQYSLKIVAAGPNSIFQRIESATSTPLVGQTVTFSFYYKRTSGTGDLDVRFYHASAQDNFSSSPQFGSTVVLSSSPSSAWTRYSTTITLPSTVSNGLQVLINSAGNTTSFIAGAQLEVGSTPTAFKRNGANIGEELASCQRYYYRASSTSGNPYAIFTQPMSANSGNQAYLPIRLPVTMRTPPSSIDFANLQLADNVNAGVTVTGAFLDVNTSAQDIAAAGFNVSSGLTQYRAYVARGNNSATAFLGFSAEL